MNPYYKVPNDFYNEETRCDFIVTNKRKKVWAVQLEMLNKFKHICSKYNLKYYAAFKGCSSETEASFETITFLIEKAKEKNSKIGVTFFITSLLPTTSPTHAP